MANHKQPPHLRGSVFAKLVAIMLAMAACLLLMVAGFFWLIVSPNFSFSVDRLAHEYAAAIAATAPNRQTAIEIRNRLDVLIRYEGPGGDWATDNDLPSITEVRAGSAHRSPKGRDYYLVASPSGGTYLFAWNLIQPMRAVHIRLLVLLLFLMLVVLLCAHAVLKLLLRPVRWLGEGVERLGSGQLDVELPIRTRDEFGALTDAFNRMVRRVREMIQARNQLLLDVSHELRSPLTRMKVALEFLPDSESKEELVSDLGEMEMMVAELLELERLRDGRGLNPSVQRIAPILNSLHEANSQYRISAPGNKVPVRQYSKARLQTFRSSPSAEIYLDRSLRERCRGRSLRIRQSVLIGRFCAERRKARSCSFYEPGPVSHQSTGMACLRARRAGGV